MTILRAALRSVGRRIRAERSLFWGSVGLSVGVGLGVLVQVIAFWQPIENAWVISLLCLLAGMLAGAALGILWPVPLAAAAKRADALGLMARTQTALEWEKEQDSPMVLLQREDARHALSALDVRQAIPLRVCRMACLVTAGLVVAGIGLQFLPNPQHAVLQAKADFRQEMQKQAELLEQGAEKIDEADAKAQQETRKLLGDLAKELRQAQDPREALSALDEADQKLNNLRQNNAKDLRDALASQGMNDAAAALETGDQAALEAALGQESGQELAQSLEKAANRTGNPAVSQALQQAAQAAAAGNLSQAQMALSNSAAGNSASAGQCQALTQMARNATASAGQSMANATPGGAPSNLASLGMQSGQGNSGSGSGVGNTPGTGGGSGAGKGSTNLDAGYQNDSGSPPVQGKAPPAEKMGTYEVIYDPTRLGVEGTLTQERGDIGQGDTTQALLGPGLGSVDQSVPYTDVAYEYQQSAATAVENANLPTYVQKWVESYFASLLQ